MSRTQLADAMLKGANTEGVRESQTAYVTFWRKRGICLACALGCALIGKFDGDYREAERVYRDQQDRNKLFPVQGLFANILGISIDLAVEVEFKHLDGQSIEQIAAWLKSSEEEGETS